MNITFTKSFAKDLLEISDAAVLYQFRFLLQQIRALT
jgi:hypothetical protein